MVVRAGPAGEPTVELHPLGALPTWSWRYTAAAPADGSAGGVVLQLVEENTAADLAGPLVAA
jgi:hypothetical protein